MPAIPGTVINSSIVPNDTNATYATHQSQYGKGGWRSVLTITDLNNIPTQRRENGMVVWIASTSATYQLIGGVSNSNWYQLNIGAISGSSNVYVPSNSADWYQQPTAIPEALDILAAKSYSGVVLCNTNNYIYTINHANINPDYSIKIVTISMPAISSTQFAYSITEETSSYFKLILSGVPDDAGYKINWLVQRY